MSSEARSVLGVRAPADVGNLLNVWGVEKEQAKEAVTVAPRSVVMNERMRRTSYKGVIDVVEGFGRSMKMTLNTPLPPGSPADSFDLFRLQGRHELLGEHRIPIVHHNGMAFLFDLSCAR